LAAGAVEKPTFSRVADRHLPESQGESADAMPWIAARDSPVFSSAGDAKAIFREDRWSRDGGGDEGTAGAQTGGCGAEHGAGGSDLASIGVGAGRTSRDPGVTT